MRARIRLIILTFLCVFFVGCAKTQPALDCTNIKIIGDYQHIDIPDIQVEITDEELEIEKEYSLVRYATVCDFSDRVIRKGDIVYVTVSLYDDENVKIEDMDIDFIVGDYYFDVKLEDQMIGKKVGESVKKISADQTVFEKEENVKYVDIAILRTEEYIYPELTVDFLKENFNVSSIDEYEDMLKREAEEIERRMEMDDIKDEMMGGIIDRTVFSDDFQKDVDDRYEELVDEFTKYGELYNLTYEETLDWLGMSDEEVYSNARRFQAEWDVCRYIVSDRSLLLSDKELKQRKLEYAIDNGYDTVEELISDNGEQYLIEEIYKQLVRDYIYDLNGGL